MAFDVRVSGEHAKIVLSGDVDLQTTADLKSEIQSISGVGRLEIEAGDVTYIDSSGIAVLLLARQHCAQGNITLWMPTISDAVHRVLQIARLDTILPIGEVTTSADAGLMGLGSTEAGGPATDDDLVNQLLADDNIHGHDADGDEVALGSAADPVDDAQIAAEVAGGDFAGLDVTSIDFEEASGTGEIPAQAKDDPVIDADGMKPGTFS